MAEILFGVGWLFTLAMAVECYRRRRSPYWYWVLFVPGPLGGLAYLLYSRDAHYSQRGLQPSYHTVTPLRRGQPDFLSVLKQWKAPRKAATGTVTPISSGRRARGGKVNCSRCLRQVDRLVPYEDGRVKHYACEMCVAEIELRRSPSITFKNLEL